MRQTDEVSVKGTSKMFLGVATVIFWYWKEKIVYPVVLNKAYCKVFHWKHSSTFVFMRQRKDSEHGNNKV